MEPGYDEPNPNALRCIRSDYVEATGRKFLWDSEGSNGDHRVSVYRPKESKVLLPATFIANDSLEAPSADKFYGFKHKCVVGYEENFDHKIDDFRALAERFAPRILLHRDEEYFPSNLQFFFDNVRDFTRDGQDYFLTKQDLDEPEDTLDFFRGQKPTPTFTPRTHAFVVPKDDTGREHYVDVVYWFFFPYNRGKDVCHGVTTDRGGFTGWMNDIINDVANLHGDLDIDCAGEEKVYGNHVGDWEHVTIRFRRGIPYKMYVSSHDFGEELEWGVSDTWHSGEHPILFAAKGSHGLWQKPGTHQYVSNFWTQLGGIDLIDECATGTEWDTWNNLSVRMITDEYTSPSSWWVNYKGSWGNPERDCIAGFCRLSNGPDGPILKDAMKTDQWEMS